MPRRCTAMSRACRIPDRRTRGDVERQPILFGEGALPSTTARMDQLVDPLVNGRNETPLERCDRNLVELLQEVRVIQTGVQVLFAFLLTAPLTARFPELTALQRWDYFVTLLATGTAAILLIAPTAYHRVLFRCGDKEHLVQVANRMTLAGLAFV